MTDQQAAAPVAAADDLEPVDYYDVLVMRAIAHLPANDKRRGDRPGVNGWTIAENTGLDVLTVRAITLRLEAEGHLYRFNGLRLTGQATETFGSALWVCETCGCVDEAACEGGCSWVAPNLCSAHGPDHSPIEGRP